MMVPAKRVFGSLQRMLTVKLRAALPVKSRGGFEVWQPTSIVVAKIKNGVAVLMREIGGGGKRS